MLSGVNSQADGLPDVRQHGRAGGPRRHDHRRALQLRDARRPATASSSTSSRRRSSAARPPTAASGTVAGTVIGALFFGLLNIGMGIMSIPIDYQFMIKALVLLVAVYFDVASKNKEALSRPGPSRPVRPMSPAPPPGRAARLHGRRDVRLHAEPAPVPRAGEVVVRVTAVGLCGSDLHWYDEGVDRRDRPRARRSCSATSSRA